MSIPNSPAIADALERAIAAMGLTTTAMQQANAAIEGGDLQQLHEDLVQAAAASRVQTKALEEAAYASAPQ